MYTPEALEQRLAVRGSHEFMAAARAWWEWLMPYTPPWQQAANDSGKAKLAAGAGAGDCAAAGKGAVAGALDECTYCAMAMVIQEVRHSPPHTHTGQDPSRGQCCARLFFCV